MSRPVVGLALLVVFFGINFGWRIVVKADEKSELVERGPFRWVRNPIFSSMLVSVGWLVLLLSNVISVTAFVMMLTAVELQVRLVEDPTS